MVTHPQWLTSSSCILLVLIKLIFIVHFCFKAHFIPQKFSYARSSFDFITSKIRITCLEWPQPLYHTIHIQFNPHSHSQLPLIDSSFIYFNVDPSILHVDLWTCSYTVKHRLINLIILPPFFHMTRGSKPWYLDMPRWFPDWDLSGLNSITFWCGIHLKVPRGNHGFTIPHTCQLRWASCLFLMQNG